MKKKKNIEKNLALTLARIQACSDAGKNIFRLKFENEINIKILFKAYEQKDKELLKAIHIIKRITSETAGVKYEITKDTERTNCSIVYFSYNLCGKKRQISFHTFSNEIAKFQKQNPTVRWDHGDSRANAQELIEYFGF